jgi:hypothetical protein
MDQVQTIIVGLVASVTILAEFLGAVFAIHNIIMYIIKQERYKAHGASLVVFYVLAVLVFSFRVA